MNKKRFLYRYIHTRMICVMATNGTDNMPESAVMEFGDTPDLELIFDTLNTTRKYRNLKQNPNISVVIGWEKGTTVQYEGQAHELKGKELLKYKKIMFVKNPDFQKWEHLPNMTYFKVIPQWIRYSAMDTKPWEIRFS